MGKKYLKSEGKDEKRELKRTYRNKTDVKKAESSKRKYIYEKDEVLKGTVSPVLEWAKNGIVGWILKI
jgi:hypothetical protein